MRIIIMIGIVNLNLDELHRSVIILNLPETHIKRSNIQNNVIHDDITRNEKENSYILQAHHICPTDRYIILRDVE
jgi:hypothetical protein